MRNLFVISCCLSFSLSASVFWQGPAQNSTNTFTVPVALMAYDHNQHIAYLGAQASSNGNTYAVSAAPLTNAGTIVSLTPSTVKLDGQEVGNPLIGAAITNAAVLLGAPIVMTGVSGGYWIKNTFSPSLYMLSWNMGSCPNGSAVGDCYDLQACEREIIGDGLYALVSPGSSNFGVVGSGITQSFVQHDTSTNTYSFLTATPIPLDVTSSACVIGSDNLVTMMAENINPTLCLRYVSYGLSSQHNNGFFYVGMGVQSDVHLGDGAQAVVMAPLSGGGICYPLVPADVITGQNTIIAAAVTSEGTPVQISIQQVKTMHTSTGLDYLVVWGDVGTIAATNKLIYALPLTNTGVLAKCDAVPMQLFYSMYPYYSLGTSFVDPVTTSTQLFTNTDIQAQVGGGPLGSAATAIEVVHDVVVATTNQGIFGSRALFDNLGRIKGWTRWSRLSGDVHAGMSSVIDSGLEEWFFVDSTGLVARSTGWAKGLGILGQLFADQPSGLQGLEQIAYDNPLLASISKAFRTPATDQLGIMMLTGYQKVVLAQSQLYNTDLSCLVPLTSWGTLYQNNQASLSALVTPVQGLVLSGGALNNIGPIVTSALGTDGTQGWFFVGGNGGVAVLADTQGAGFPQGLVSGFVGMPTTLIFQVFNNFINVRKLVVSGNCLFILTQNQLVRFNLTSGLSAEPTVLFETTNNTNFNDCAVCGPLLILATSDGLYRSGNGVDSRTAGQLSLVTIPLPVDSLGVFSIMPIGFYEDPTRIFDAPLYGGNCLVMAGDVSNHRSFLFRFSLQLTNSVVDNTTMIFLPDRMSGASNSAMPSIFFRFGTYENFLGSDGIAWLCAKSSYTILPPMVTVLRSTAVDIRLNPLLGSMNVFNAAGALSVYQPKWIWGSGLPVIGGDFGIFVGA
jgi:hypothetical protein